MFGVRGYITAGVSAYGVDFVDFVFCKADRAQIADPKSEADDREQEQHYDFNCITAPRDCRRTHEIGPGPGEHLEHERLTDAQAANYYAVDIRDNMAADIKRRFPRINTVVADCQKCMAFEDGFFDRIIAIHVLEHLPDLPAAIRELHRVCDKARGVLSIVIPCEGSLAYSFARSISAKPMFERRYGQPYDTFIKREHINLPHEIFEEIAPYFVRRQSTYFPLPVPLEFCNLCIGATFAPREVVGVR